MSKFQKRHTDVGARPGTLVIPSSAAPPKVRVMHYTEDSLDEREIVDVDELAAYLDRPAVTWIDVQGLGDEDILRRMADLTGGTYYRAQDAKQLYTVFADLPKKIVLQKQRMEISVLFTALGSAFAGTAAALALLWHRFP